MEGDNWQEKFTRGARRRRSSSLDSSGDDLLLCRVRYSSSDTDS